MTTDILAGTTVVEFAEGIAGPFGAQLLVDMGARVIKVEPPDGDWARGLEAPDGTIPVFLGCNRGKESLCVDLRSDEGPAIVRSLVERADVLLQAYRPGVAERYGLAPDELLARNERLVYCSLSGYGDRGPLRERPGTDTIMQAFSGLMSTTGEPDGGPVRVGTAIGDTSAGVYAALAIVALLLRRQRTGRGGRCDTSLLEALIHLQTTTYSDVFAGVRPRRLGSRSSLAAAPAEAVPTRDGFVSISCHVPRQWAKLCAAIGRPELADDERFADNRSRVAHHDELMREIAAALRARTTAEWMAMFEAQGVNAAPINAHADVVAHDHVQATGIFRRLVSERWGDFTLVDMPITVDGEVQHPAPRDPPALGEHSERILAELGHDRDGIRALVDAGVVPHAAAGTLTSVKRTVG